MNPNPSPAAAFINIAFMIAIVAIWGFVLTSDQRKKQKQLKSMLDALKKNDEVVTIAGIYGTISSIKENTVVVKVDDNVKIEMDKTAIARVIKSA